MMTQSHSAPMTVSASLSPGSTGSAFPIEDDSNAEAVTPITLSPYSFGAASTANPNAIAGL